MSKLEKGQSYTPCALQFSGWWSTPAGEEYSLDGYNAWEYFDGPFFGPAIYLGPDCYGVEPLFSQNEYEPE